MLILSNSFLIGLRSNPFYHVRSCARLAPQAPDDAASPLSSVLLQRVLWLRMLPWSFGGCLLSTQQWWCMANMTEERYLSFLHAHHDKKHFFNTLKFSIWSWCVQIWVVEGWEYKWLMTRKVSSKHHLFECYNIHTIYHFHDGFCISWMRFVFLLFQSAFCASWCCCLIQLVQPAVPPALALSRCHI